MYGRLGLIDNIPFRIGNACDDVRIINRPSVCDGGSVSNGRYRGHKQNALAYSGTDGQ